MRRPWLVWATSAAAFCVMAVAIVISESAQRPARGDQSFSEKNNGRLNPSVYAPAAGLELIGSAQNFVARFENKRVYGGNADDQVSVASVNSSTKSSIGYQPREVVSLAHPSNYGERFPVDVNGNPLNNQYIVVLHETVGSASSALNLFQNNHPNDNDQVSYHTLIGLDGTVYYVVPPEQRAFGAGNSTFRSAMGEESVSTNPDFPSSVNNFAYHISLETPPDGQNNNSATHSGYTEAQYQSLAWLLARTTVPDDRITTHKAVDRSGSRSDPRSFEPQRLLTLLNQYPSRAGL